MLIMNHVFLKNIKNNSCENNKENIFLYYLYMNISPTTKKRINDRERLVKKHEREIEEQKIIISDLENEIEKLEDDMENEFDDIYNSAKYKRIWNDFKVNKSIAKKRIYVDNYKNPIMYINNRIQTANNLLKQATEKRDKRIAEILNILPKKTKTASLRRQKSKSRSGSPKGASGSPKGASKKGGGRKRNRKTKRKC